MITIRIDRDKLSDPTLRLLDEWDLVTWIDVIAAAKAGVLNSCDPVALEELAEREVDWFTACVAPESETP